MQDLSPYIALVDQCISNLGVDPSICKTPEKPGQWDLKKGSASVWIDVFWDEKNNCGYFQCMAPVCEIPAVNREAFFEEVLKEAHNLYGCAFTKHENWIYVKAIREVNNLELEEVTSTLNRIGYYGDFFDDHFRNKYFGGSDSTDAGGRHSDS